MPSSLRLPSTPGAAASSMRAARPPSHPIEEALRLALREGLHQQLSPLQAQLASISTALEGLTALTSLASAVTRLRERLTAAPAPQVSSVVPPPRARPAPPAEEAGCALVGCKRPTRSLGYCAAHYQKRRLLEARGLLPERWVKGALPGTVVDVHLPRGRRPGHEETPAVAAPAAPAGPRAWVRRKGQQLQPLAPQPSAPGHEAGTAASVAL